MSETPLSGCRDTPDGSVDDVGAFTLVTSQTRDDLGDVLPAVEKAPRTAER